MKRKSFILLFVATHVLFIALQINKQSKIVKLSYQKQRYEETKKKLLEQKQNYTNQLFALKKPSQIKQFATQKLAMKPLDLKQIKRIQSS